MTPWTSPSRSCRSTPLSARGPCRTVLTGLALRQWEVVSNPYSQSAPLPRKRFLVSALTSMLDHRPAIHLNQILRWCTAITTVLCSSMKLEEVTFTSRTVLSAAALLSIVATLFALRHRVFADDGTPRAWHRRSRRARRSPGHAGPNAECRGGGARQGQPCPTRRWRRLRNRGRCWRLSDGLRPHDPAGG